MMLGRAVRSLLVFALLGFAACMQPTAAAKAPLAEALLAHARAWSEAAETTESARGELSDLAMPGRTHQAHAASAPPAALDFARSELDRMARRVRALQEREPEASVRALLRRVVFDESQFVREVDDPSLRYVLLPSVLKLRRGSCVGLGTLYLALAERLGLDMHGVLVPGHFYVRLREQGQVHNIELLRRAEELADSFYRERWPVTTSSRAYARPLTAAEVEAVLLFDIGNELKRAKAFAPAERAFAQAAQLFPDFAEAQASAGSMAHLLGALDRAQKAYAAARAADPQLAGLDDNVALLRAEVNAAAATRPQAE